jgi:hypothetical protein
MGERPAARPRWGWSSRFAILAMVGGTSACEGDVQSSWLTTGDGLPTDATTSASAEHPRTSAPYATQSTSSGASMTTSPASSSSEPVGSPSSSSTTTMPWPTTGMSSSPVTETSASTDVTSDESTSNPTSESSDSSEETSGPALTFEFDITLEFLPSAQSLDADIKDAFTRAKAFWENVIVGDLPDVTIVRPQVCVSDSEESAVVRSNIDDLHIFVAAKAIDGVDGVLGAAGPCLSHGARNNLPVAGYMQFDTADLRRYADEGRLEEIVAHEMGHVLGFGGLLWSYPQASLGGQSFLADPSSDQGRRDTHFIGPTAIAEFDSVGGSAYNGAKVPVENTGGQGTVNSHWREDVMGNELMTSFMTNRDGLLSRVTIAALEDMGYEVNYAAAEAYVWPPPNERGRFLKGGEELAPVNFGNDVLQIPIRNIE